MIVDLSSADDGMTLRADVCIVGAGAAGLTLARELLDSPLGVVVLESGGIGFESHAQRLNDGQSVGVNYDGYLEGRRRQLGGATKVWGGVCSELDPIDFEHRPWVPYSGWPIGPAELAPYYRLARVWLECPALDDPVRSWGILHRHAPDLDPRLARFTVTGTTPRQDLARAGLTDLRQSRHVIVCPAITVRTIQVTPSGTAAAGVAFLTRRGRSGFVQASTVVLCGGGIENARLLLASRSRHPAGIGNGRDLVGRFFADHTRSFTANVTPLAVSDFRLAFQSIRHRQMSLSPRVLLGVELQRNAQLLNAAAEVVDVGDRRPSYAAALRLRTALRRRGKHPAWRRDLATTLRGTPILLKLALDRYLRGRHPFDERTTLRLQVVAEQQPDPASRVMLGAPIPPFGLLGVRIDWRVSESERRTIAEVTRRVASELTRLGLARVELRPWLHAGNGRDWRAALEPGYHHIGTTRMADDPASGVVDRNLRVHGVGGLYVCGSSVFPTGGQASPTLTIVALAIRLADHLKSGRALEQRRESVRPSELVTQR